jgi:hypothetical protein
MSESRAMAGSALGLSCHPHKVGNLLMFPYSVENRGRTDLYVMDVLPSVDRASSKARADENAAVVILGAEGDAIVGKFAAPLPTDRRIALPVLPLARLLPGGASFDGRLEIPIPLAETSPYFADLSLRKYEIVEINGVIFTIGYWPAGVDGLVATPADYATDRFVIVTRNTLKSALSAGQRFQTTGLQLFKRTDAYPRTLG